MSTVTQCDFCRIVRPLNAEGWTRPNLHHSLAPPAMFEGVLEGVERREFDVCPTCQRAIQSAILGVLTNRTLPDFEARAEEFDER